MIRTRINSINGMYECTPSYENSPELDRISIPVEWNGHFTGWYGQCIEFVRRYLIQHFSLTFPSVRTAEELFRRLTEPSFLQSIQSRGQTRARCIRVNIPRAGDLVFLRYPVTGHVGIVTRFNRRTDEIAIADQNYEYGTYWTSFEYAYTLPRTSPEIRGFIRILP